MWISWNWYSLCPLWVGCQVRSIAIKPLSLVFDPKSEYLMRKTIVINTLLILGYYLILQALIWIAMVLR